jgi:hypothetical protein
MDQTDSVNDDFIAARPAPLLACGVASSIRNTIEVITLDIEVGMDPSVNLIFNVLRLHFLTAK